MRTPAPDVVIDRTHMRRRASGIERATDALFSPAALAPLRISAAEAVLHIDPGAVAEVVECLVGVLKDPGGGGRRPFRQWRAVIRNLEKIGPAAKTAVPALVELMRASGLTLLDVQWCTDHLASLGAISISRREYLTLLADAVAAATQYS